MARPIESNLYQSLLESNFSIMERGIKSITEIYSVVKNEYPLLCDDNYCCPHGINQPEWNHTVRTALNRLKVISENIFYTGNRGFWNFI